MKGKHLLMLLAAVLLIASCDKVDPRYDAPDGINREMTLFGEEFTLPLGSLAPITLRDALDRVPLVSSLIQTDDEGYLLLSGSKEIATWSVDDISALIDDDTQPYGFTPEAASTGLPTVPMLLGLFGFHFPNQTYTFTATNPLDVEVPMSAKFSVGDYFDVIREERAKGIELLPGDNEVAEIVLPGVQESEPSLVSAEDILLYVPEELPDHLFSRYETDFALSFRFRSRIALASYLDFPFSYTLQSLQLPVGRFKLHEMSVSLEVESTLPVRATVESIELLDGEGNPDPNVTFGGGLVINGGTMETPVTTPLTLTVKAVEGTIPDIGSLRLQLRFGTDASFGLEAISASQGITVKSSSITIRGGITLFSHE